MVIFLEDKSVDFQNCFELYVVKHLCAIIHTPIWAVLTDELF